MTGGFAKAEKDTTFTINDISTQVVLNVAKFTGSKQTATDLLSKVAKLNQDYMNGRKTEDEWHAEVNKLAEKAVPEDTKARLRLHQIVFDCSPVFSMGSAWIAHTIVPLKSDKVYKLEKELETGPPSEAAKRKQTQ